MEETCHAYISEHLRFGRVLVLTDAVVAGESIVVESPMIRVGIGGTAAFYTETYASLSAEQRLFLTKFASNPEMTKNPICSELLPEVDHFRRVLGVNAHSFAREEQQALFPLISFAQHSCNPNAAYTSISSLALGRLYAVRDIAAGDHVTISYLPRSPNLRLWPKWYRQNELKNLFFFVCCCDLCESAEDRPPSHVSSRLLRAYGKLDNAYCEPSQFTPMADDLLRKCRESSAADDSQFHLFRVHDLVYEFHINYFAQLPNGEAHFLPALKSLAQRYLALTPQDDSALLDMNRLSFAFTACVMVLAKLPRASEPKWLRVAQRLWLRFGAVVRTSWTEYDPEYQNLRDVLGTPDDTLCVVGDIVRELEAVRPCCVCSVASVLLCSRCGKEAYCTPSCQREHWPKHRQICKSK
eukprot:TRINITY_DN69261_c0_g1_i1.p1 TRINITY_DN69261_c0_g1~~TRINITY_DN69261_c0_g1_i1.p1  ORF type:complete len:411 (+),score=26.93 TRINITY_DN69261_c0_g1_i1:100-1332(+)